MQKRQVRLSDLAKELGISTATVSRALKDYPDISQETKRKVLNLAKLWNYRPNSLAAGLRKSETRVIGVIIPEVLNHFFSKVIKGIMEVAYDAGYNVMLCQSNEDYEKEVKDANALLSSRVDGLMVSLGNHTHQFDHIHDFQDAGIPVVFFDKTSPHITNCSKVIVDDYQGAFLAVSNLLDEGCQRIAHLGGPHEAFTFQNRLKGYQDALKERGLPSEPALTIECSRLNYEEGREMAHQLMALDIPPDGIFAATDNLAIGVLMGLRQLNVAVPQTVAVTGFSNWEMGEVVQPSLSSVVQPGYEMGKLATELLLKEIKANKKGLPVEHHSIVLPTSLMLRESSRRMSE